MQRNVIIGVIVALILFLGALWFLLLHREAPQQKTQSSPTASSTLGGSIYTKLQAETATSSRGSFTNPANPFGAKSSSQSKTYKNPFSQ